MVHYTSEYNNITMLLPGYCIVKHGTPRNFLEYHGYFNKYDVPYSYILCQSHFRLKGYSTFLEIGSFYSSPRVKQLSLTVFESIQPIF